MPDVTESNPRTRYVKPYQVLLPNGMKLLVHLERPHPTRLQIEFADGSGVEFEFSGKTDPITNKAIPGTTKGFGGVHKKDKDLAGKNKRWSPSNAPAAANATFPSTQAYLDTGEH